MKHMASHLFSVIYCRGSTRYAEHSCRCQTQSWLHAVGH